MVVVREDGFNNIESSLFTPTNAQTTAYFYFKKVQVASNWHNLARSLFSRFQAGSVLIWLHWIMSRCGLCPNRLENVRDLWYRSAEAIQEAITVCIDP